MSHWSDKLPADACGEAKTWCDTQSSLEAAWARCEQADWMLWLLGRLSGLPESEARKRVVACACDCAETAVQFINDDKVKAATVKCLETTRAWIRGEATIEHVRAARNAVAADAYAARTTALREMAAIVRRHYPSPPAVEE